MSRCVVLGKSCSDARKLEPPRRFFSKLGDLWFFFVKEPRRTLFETAEFLVSVGNSGVVATAVVLAGLSSCSSNAGLLKNQVSTTKPEFSFFVIHQSFARTYADHDH
jgi:hypothetical protein